MKPGQLCTIKGHIYRAKKRTEGCNGCSLDNFFTCPYIKSKKKNRKFIDCYTDNIILVRVR